MTSTTKSLTSRSLGRSLWPTPERGSARQKVGRRWSSAGLALWVDYSSTYALAPQAVLILVQFYRPSAKMILTPGSWKEATKPPVLFDISLEAVQTLAA